MIFRWTCDKCKKEIENGKDRLKLTSVKEKATIHRGDLCEKCWGEIKK